MEVYTFSKSVRGSSHISNGKPMQDRSEHVHLEDCDILLLSDGHGSDKHFRSDRGAKFAIEAARESLAVFIKGFSPTLSDDALIRRGIIGIKDPTSDDYTPKDLNEREFRQLFENIKFRWCEKVSHDWVSNPPTEEELQKANTQGKPISLSYYNKGNEIKAYGCTLMAAVRTPTYWIAFQIGDGKCIAYSKDGSWYEPIPWDSRCFLTTTTSLCHEGSESFRYCYGNNSCPALFMGSDGMDGSYMPLEKLVEFYSLVIRVVAEEGIEFASEQLEKMMPKISEDGSHDDISIAFWVDSESLNELNYNVMTKELESIEKDISATEKKKKVAESKIEELSERGRQLGKESEELSSQRIEYNTKIEAAQNEKEKAEEDFKIASFLFKEAKEKFDQANSAFEQLKIGYQECERSYEINLKDIETTECKFKENKAKTTAFETYINVLLQKKTFLRKLLRLI